MEPITKNQNDNENTNEINNELGEKEETIEDSKKIATPKFVVVTGAFGGLGKAVTRKLLDEGFVVFGLDMVIDEEFTDDNFMPIQVDITSEKSLYNAYKIVDEYTDYLYAIINLAGIFYFDSIVEGDEDRLRHIIEVNFFGTYNINKVFIPFLNVGESRIINVSSEMAKYSQPPFNGYYGLSKLLVDGYTDVLRRELNYIGIKVVKVRAGSFKTNMHENVNNEFDKMIEATNVYKDQLTKLKFMMDRELENAGNPEEFAKCIVKIVKKKKPKICYSLRCSKKLKALNMLSEKTQDKIYLREIK